MKRLTGCRLDNHSRRAIDDGVRSLISHNQPVTDGDRVVVVPDANYPFHPSTGMVTNPEVVESVCRAIDLDSTEVLLLVAGSEFTDDQSVAEWLGYRSLTTEFDVTLTTPSVCKTTQSVVDVGDRQVEVSLPAPLVENPVVNVPTLRLESDSGIHGAMVNLGRLAKGEGSRAERTVAATAVVDPRFTLLDGTYVYVDQSHRGSFLVAGEDPVALDCFGAELLGNDVTDVPYLDIAGSEETPVEVDGLSVPTLARELPDGPPPSSGSGPSTFLRSGYQLYARLSGDLLPPQVLDEGHR